MRKYLGKIEEKEEIVDAKIRTRVTSIMKIPTTKITVVSTAPYSIYNLRSSCSRRRRCRRCRSNNNNSLCSLEQTTLFEDATNCRRSSSNFTALMSSSSTSCKFDRICVTTTDLIPAVPKVKSDVETLSQFVDCNITARGETMDGLIYAKTKSTVEIKPIVTPSKSEIDDFFSSAEKHLQKRFSDRYNFDIVKDVPLQGRYEWVQIKP